MSKTSKFMFDVFEQEDALEHINLPLDDECKYTHSNLETFYFDAKNVLF